MTSLSIRTLALTLSLAATARAQPQVIGRACGADEVPYFDAGCDGPARRRCWPANVHPTPMTFCACDGRTSSAPLPGGGLRWRHAGPCAARPTPAPLETPTPAAPTEVPTWLSRCVDAPRNGLNPQVEVPPDLIARGRAALVAAVLRGPRDQRRCAAWALSRHGPTRELRPFWRQQLTRSRDAQVITEAFIALSELADPADLDLALEQYAQHPHLRHMMAGRLRNWRDRRVVPALVALLAPSEPEVIRRNAASSLEVLGMVPRQSPDANPPHTAPGAGADTTAAPYRRWWEREGRARFAQEQAAWEALTARVRAVTGLEPDWIEAAR